VRRILLLAIALTLFAGCGADDDDDASPAIDGGLAVERVWPTDQHPGQQFDGCVYGSPLAFEDGGASRVVIVEGRGTVAVVDPATGDADWTVMLPAPAGERPDVFATPVIVQGLLVVAYHTLDPDGDASVNAPRLRQRVAVVDLAARELAADFAPLDLSARVPAWDGGEVEFLVGAALERATVAHVPAPTGAGLGHVVVTYGNARDIQPWHGWAFEVDLDAWRAGGPDAAVSGVLVTTAENDCGQAGASGATERQCGGGLWSPSGPLVVPDGDGSALILAPDNGRLDPARRSYSNTLMRVRPGMVFDPGCDPVACADFDPNAPSEACVESCRDLWVPRVPAGEEPALPESWLCQGLGMFECWELLDYGGGSTPVQVLLPSGPVLLYPMKDGNVYVVDGEHLGTLHERHHLVDVCGTADSPCHANWAGMIITQPALTEVDGVPFAIVPTFMEDDVRPAGVFGLRVLDDPPRLEEAWRTPGADAPDAIRRFRLHPSRVALGRPDDPGEYPEGYGGPERAFVLERPADVHARGHLLVLDVATGALLADVRMAGPAQRFTLPLVVGDVVVVNSCDSDQGPGHLEGWRVEASIPP